MSRTAKIWTVALITIVFSALAVAFLALFAMSHGDVMIGPEIMLFPYAAIVGAFDFSHRVQLEVGLILGQFPVYGLLLGRAWVKDSGFHALLVLAAHFSGVIAAGIIRDI